MLLLVAAARSSAGGQIAPSPAWARVDSVTPATAPTNYKNASVTVSWAPVIGGATGKPWAGYVLKMLACPGWSGVVVRTTTVTLTGCTCGNGGDPHVQSAASGDAGASKPVYFVTRTNGSHNLFIPCNEQHQDPWAKFPPIPNPMNEAADSATRSSPPGPSPRLGEPVVGWWESLRKSLSPGEWLQVACKAGGIAGEICGYFLVSIVQKHEENTEKRIACLRCELNEAGRLAEAKRRCGTLPNGSSELESCLRSLLDVPSYQCMPTAAMQGASGKCTLQ